MEPKDEIIEGHEYDGIQEFDNPLPGWWLAIFLGSIIFSFIYWIHYSFQPGTGLAEEFKIAWQEIQVIQAKQQANGPTFKSEELLAAIQDPQRLSGGGTVYVAKCASCHGTQGEGLVGPNLTDNFWIHGKGTPEDLTHSIAKGVLDKGMPAWETMMSKDELLNVVVYVASLRGKNIPGKEPQGEEAR